MTKEKAIDLIMRGLGLGDLLRPFVTRRVGELTDYAQKIDKDTVSVLKDRLRKELK